MLHACSIFRAIVPAWRPLIEWEREGRDLLPFSFSYVSSHVPSLSYQDSLSSSFICSSRVALLLPFPACFFSLTQPFHYLLLLHLLTLSYSLSPLYPLFSSFEKQAELLLAPPRLYRARPPSIALFLFLSRLKSPFISSFLSPSLPRQLYSLFWDASLFLSRAQCFLSLQFDRFSYTFSLADGTRGSTKCGAASRTAVQSRASRRS